MRIDCSQQSRKSNENSDAEKVDDDDDDKNRNMKQAALDALDVSQLPSRIMRFSDRIAANCCLSQGAAPNSRIVFLNVNLLRQEIESNLPSMPKENIEALFEQFDNYSHLKRPLSITRFKAIFSAWASKLIETNCTDNRMWLDFFDHKHRTEEVDTGDCKMHSNSEYMPNEDLELTMLVDPKDSSLRGNRIDDLRNQDEISHNSQTLSDYSLNLSSQQLKYQSLPGEASSHPSNKSTTNNNSEISCLRQKIDSRDRIITNLQAKNLEMLKYKVECHNLKNKITGLETKVKNLKTEVLGFQKKKLEAENRNKDTNQMLSKSISKCDNLNQILKNCVKERDNMQQENIQLQYSMQSNELENTMMKQQLDSLKLNNEILSEKVASLSYSNISANALYDSANWEEGKNENSCLNLNKSSSFIEVGKINVNYKNKLRKISDIANDLKNMNNSNTSMITNLKEELLATTKIIENFQKNRYMNLKQQISGFLDLTMNSVCLSTNRAKRKEMELRESIKKTESIIAKISLTDLLEQTFKEFITNNINKLYFFIIFAIIILVAYFTSNLIKFGSLLGITEIWEFHNSAFYNVKYL